MLEALWRRRRGLQGGRGASWRDLAAPEVITVHPDHLTLADGRVACTLAAVGFPRTVGSDWLAFLAEYAGEYRAAQHVEPVDADTALADLDRDLRQSSASVLIAQTHGRPADVRDEGAVQDAEQLRAALAAGDVRLFRHHLLITLMAADLEELGRCCGALMRHLEAHLLTVRRCLWREAEGFASTLPTGHLALACPRNFDSDALAAGLPLAGVESPEDGGEVWGLDVERQTVVSLDRQQLPNAHALCLAGSGAGKSFVMKHLLTQVAMGGGRVVVLDPQGEYGAWSRALGGRVVRLFTASGETLNPLARPPERSPREWLLVVSERVADLVEVLGGAAARPLPGVVHTALLRGDGLAANPTLPGVARALREFGTPGKAASEILMHALEGWLRPFAGSQPYRRLTTVLAFDLRATAAQPPAARAAALLLLSHHVVDHLAAPGLPRLTVAVDEAHHILDQAHTARLVEVLFRTGRKLGVAVCLATQSVGDLLGSDARPEAARAARAALANSATVFLMRQQNGRELSSLRDIYGLDPADVRWLQGCGVGEGLLVVGQRRQRVHVEAPPALHALFGPEIVAADVPPEPQT